MENNDQRDHHRHHFEKFSEQDKEISSLKTNVGIIQADVQTLAKGQVDLQSSMTQGFKNISEALNNNSLAPPKIGVGLLVSLIGAFAIGVGAFYMTITLLIKPISDSTLTNREHFLLLNDHVNEASARRHDEQESKIEDSSDDIKELNAQRISDAREAGKIEAEIKSVKEDIEDLDGTRDDNRAELSKIESELSALKVKALQNAEYIKMTDYKGSRKLVEENK